MIGNFIFFAFLVLIPTQLGKHFWPDWSLVSGLRVDYLSPTLYLLDIIWVGLFVTDLKKLKFDKWWIIVGIFAGINILVAINKPVAIYRWIWIGQWAILFEIIKGQKLKVERFLKTVIPVWLIVEVGLGLWQVYRGASVGGFFYWLGERTFNQNTPGVALLSIAGREFLRAYGTFSHPNSMAGFLLVSLLLWQLIIKQRTWWYWLILGIGTVGVVIAGSRVVWGLTILLLISSVKFLMSNKRLMVTSVVIFGVGGWWIYQNYFGGWDSDGWNKRVMLVEAAVALWEKSPLFGVGFNNFLVRLSEVKRNGGVFWLQPVHNIPLLWLVESGLVGTGVFLMGLIKLWNKKYWRFFLVMGITSLIDHYWWSLPQNWWLSSVVLSILL